jgi:hypothetical protein
MFAEFHRPLPQFTPAVCADLDKALTRIYDRLGRGEFDQMMDEYVWSDALEVCIDPGAAPGNPIPVLARVLRRLARETAS